MTSIGLYGQGYRIEIEIKGLSGDTLILGEYFTSRMVPKDTLILNKNGTGIFEDETPFQGGLYLIYISPEKYFDFLIGDDQSFSIKADSADLAASIDISGSEDNSLFMEYKSFLQEKRTELNQIQVGLSSAANSADSARVQKQVEKINRKMEAYMDDFESEHAPLFVTKFIGATREPIPPEEFLNGNRKHDDSIRFFYRKEHFLDRFDPFDVRILHTPLYEGKIKRYIGSVVPQHPDSLIVAADYLLEGAKIDENLYRYLLITLFNHFAESKFMGMDAVYFHIAEYYYIPDASWSNAEFISKLKENLDMNKPTLIGQKAPNLIMRRIPADHFHMAMQDTAIKKDPHIGEDFFTNDIDASFIILYFWESDCSHCKKSTPALYEFHSRLKDKGVEVISVHVINTIEGKELWVDFVNEYGLYDWVNCWSPYSNDFRRLYNLQSYPQLFILDKDKKIVAKRVTPEQAEQIINNLIALESKNKP
ncbi:MAG: redoxin domain-containing protein [Bacteroidetes bacterium]|nr:redoxin domain-containing protein [Bacteroidota bacterium]